VQQQQQHCQQVQQQAAAPSSSRRWLLASGAAAATPFSGQLLFPGSASAYIVDETVAQSVFALAARSVVSINDYKQQAGAEIFEGVGTGFVWDKYGHGEWLRLAGKNALAENRTHCAFSRSQCQQHLQLV
jgi:hypothetical protein